MTSVTFPGEPKKYNARELGDTLEDNGISAEDHDYITAVFNDPMFIDRGDGTYQLMNIDSCSHPLYWIDDGETGYYAEGGNRIVIVNRFEITHYDLFSSLCAREDAHVYLISDEDWTSENDEESGYTVGFFRSDAYPDTYKEDE